MTKKLLFITHVGAPGGAEYKMMDDCSSTKYKSKVVHFQHGPIEKILKDKDIHSSVLPMPSSMANFTKDDGIFGVLKAIPATLSMIKSLEQEIKQHDITICVSQKSFILASLAKPFTRKPIIWFMNDILSPHYFNSALIKILKITSRLCANHIVLNSNASFKAWEEAGAKTDNVSIIYPGTNFSKFETELTNEAEIIKIQKKYSPDKKPLIGIFGRISEWKGQDIFLKAIAKIPNTNAIIVGDALFGEDKYKKSLIDLAENLNIKDRVYFTGHLDNIPCTMAACDVIAHCSTLPEPFGKVIVEASAAGTPVIASDAGGAKEIIIHDQTGQLTPMGDVDALQTAIEKYIDNPELAKEMALKAKEKGKKEFSTAAMIKNFENLIEKIN